MGVDEGRSQDIHMPDEGANPDAIGRERDLTKVGQMGNIDEHKGLGQAQVERGDEALPAGEDAGAFAMPGEQGEGVRLALGADVGEGWRFQWSSPRFRAWVGRNRVNPGPLRPPALHEPTAGPDTVRCPHPALRHCLRAARVEAATSRDIRGIGHGVTQARVG